MRKIPHNRLSCHVDFGTTLLGTPAKLGDLGQLTPGGRHVQKRTGLPVAVANMFAELNGIGPESSR